MRKSVLFITLLFAACIAFAQQTLFRNSSLAGFTLQGNDNFTSALSLQDEGVVINGVRWATRNVDAPGTFAARPERAGMFYQWNRRVGWSSTDPLLDSNGGDVWRNVSSTATTWATTNDPCPRGWRVPTSEELRSLVDMDKVASRWVAENGVNGRRFTDIATSNSFFLPVAGLRNYTDGAPNGVGSSGFYWSSTPNWNSTPSGTTNAMYLFLISRDTGVGISNQAMGLNVRCVFE
jgi:uncharacterized protein (TIGR02145 family)